MPPALRPAVVTAVLVPDVRRLEEMDSIVFHVCNAHAYDGRFREMFKQQGVKISGTLVTCIILVQVNRRRASITTTIWSQKALPLQRLFNDLTRPRNVVSAGGEACT